MTDKLTPVFAALEHQPRLLVEAELKPVQGDRFQPTGFPDLGAATYIRPDGTPMLLVESAQSMANRLEAVCWDEAENRIAAPLASLPHVVVDFGNGMTTSSLKEAHRLNSFYLLDADNFKSRLTEEITPAFNGALDVRKLAQAVFKVDVNSVLHGVFIAQKDIFGGRARLQRLLSSFIEAVDYKIVTSGGVKIDRLDPKGEASEGGAKGSEEGRGNIIYSRTEFTASKIIAYFNLDLATLRGYGLGDAANRLLIALALYKLLKTLDCGLRLRTACDLEVEEIKVTRPSGLSLDGMAVEDVEGTLPGLIAACGFDESSVTRISGQMPAKKKAKEAKAAKSSDDEQAGGGADE